MLNETSLSHAMKEQSLSSNNMFLWVLLKDSLSFSQWADCKCSSVIGLCSLRPKYGERFAFSSRAKTARPAMWPAWRFPSVSQIHMHSCWHQYVPLTRPMWPYKCIQYISMSNNTSCLHVENHTRTCESSMTLTHSNYVGHICGFSLKHVQITILPKIVKCIKKPVDRTS